jgi:type VI secretion system protein ImpH
MATQSRPANIDVTEPEASATGACGAGPRPAAASQAASSTNRKCVFFADFAEHPGEFDFFQAVRLLRIMSPNGDPVRFHANPALDFPPSQIEAFEMPNSGPAHMTVNFLGLVGPLGALPYFYSELVNDRVRAKDPTLKAFFDIFHHRLITLFYDAWEKHRFPALWERDATDGVSTALRAVLGIGSSGLHGRQKISDNVLLFYTGLLALHSRPATALEQLLEDYFQVPALVDQFSGAWYLLPQAQQCRLGSESCFEQLGMGAIVGDAIWNRQSRVRVRLGPMPLARYREFLPRGNASSEVEALIDFFANREYDFELQLALNREQLPESQLGTELPLGWCSWLKTEEFAHHPDDALLPVGQQLSM